MTLTNRITPGFLNEPLQFVLFGGKGGVGKTTSAVATALHIARTRPGARTLLVSTDPAHSVADSLADEEPPKNLTVLELNAEAEHQRFMESSREHIRVIAQRGTFLDDEDIARFIDLSLPGMDELMAFIRVAGWLDEHAFDHIVIDTAPSGHTLRLLDMPELLSGWLDAMDALLAKHRYMAELFGRSRARSGDATDAFLDDMRDSFKRLRDALADRSRSRFVPVMLAEAMSVAETQDMLRRLDDLGVAAPEIIVNRLVDADAGSAFASQRRQQHQVLNALPESIAARILWGAPLHGSEVRGSAMLQAFTASLMPMSAVAARTIETDEPYVPRVSGSCQIAAARPGNTHLVFFAGKGGVGKTTMAAAAAAHLAASGRRVLLASSDPAHSLGDCLRKPLSDEPTLIADGLWAVEVDAPGEFEKLRDEYRQELEEALDSMFQSIDISFDREAMERLLDLSPPGLDECMALLRIIHAIDARTDTGELLYDTIVIDPAPTGHLLRLLELPELIEKWLNALFSVFIKYDHVFRLPRLQSRLIAISKGLKRLRAILKDPRSASVCVVTIPTEMALAETCDLVAMLGRMHVAIDALIINMVLPEDGSSLGSSVSAREAFVRARYASEFPRLPRAEVFRVGDPRGHSVLAMLGGAVFSASRTAGRLAA